MLTLKKEKRSAEILLVLTKKEGLLTKSFFLSFSIAFLFHLFAWGTFHIASLGPSKDPIQLPYLPAIADLPKLTVFAEIEGNSNGFLESLLTLPLASSKEEKIPPFPKENPLMLALFKEEETPDWQLPLLDPPSLSFSPSIPYDSYVISVSKGLPEPLEKKPLQKIGPLPTQHLFTYQVELDGESGKIIWYEKIKGEKDKRLTARVEELLLSLEFPKIYEPFASGEVEITLRS